MSKRKETFSNPEDTDMDEAAKRLRMINEHPQELEELLGSSNSNDNPNEHLDQDERANRVTISQVVECQEWNSDINPPNDPQENLNERTDEANDDEETETYSNVIENIVYDSKSDNESDNQESQDDSDNDTENINEREENSENIVAAGRHPEYGSSSDEDYVPGSEEHEPLSYDSNATDEESGDDIDSDLSDDPESLQEIEPLDLDSNASSESDLEAKFHNTLFGYVLDRIEMDNETQENNNVLNNNRQVRFNEYDSSSSDTDESEENKVPSNIRPKTIVKFIESMSDDSVETDEPAKSDEEDLIQHRYGENVLFNRHLPVIDESEESTPDDSKDTCNEPEVAVVECDDDVQLIEVLQELDIHNHDNNELAMSTDDSKDDEVYRKGGSEN